MKLTTVSGVAVATAVLGIGGAFYANAGDLNPPAGPVDSTMVTLDDIYNEVRGVDPADAPVEYYMTIPGIQGELVGVPGIPNNSVQLDELSFNLRAPFLSGGGGGGGIGPLRLNSFDITIPFNTTMPQFMSKMAMGAGTDGVELRGRTTGAGPSQEVMRVRLDGVYFEEYTAAGAQAHVTLVAAQMDVLAMSPDGNQTGAFCWNFQAATNCN